MHWVAKEIRATEMGRSLQIPQCTLEERWLPYQSFQTWLPSCLTLLGMELWYSHSTSCNKASLGRPISRDSSELRG